MLGQQDRTLIFVHIPKTAGTTLAIILRKLYSTDRTGSGYAVKPHDLYSRLSAAERQSHDLVLGHLAYGLHQHVLRPYAYVGFVREPADRLMSLYYYIVRTPDNYLYEA